MTRPRSILVADPSHLETPNYDPSAGSAMTRPVLPENTAASYAIR